MGRRFGVPYNYACMNEKERQDSPDSSRRGYGSELQGPGERRNGKNPFQWALEVEDLLDKQKPSHGQGGRRIRTRYIE
jgi:hypothetical protein